LVNASAARHHVIFRINCKLHQVPSSLHVNNVYTLFITAIISHGQVIESVSDPDTSPVQVLSWLHKLCAGFRAIALKVDCPLGSRSPYRTPSSSIKSNRHLPSSAHSLFQFRQ